ncbi:MAG: NADPH:quinone oxidoreductase family protein [Hyphomicrobiales bacterium]|nr:NADPH:quinone oxidoreductase family protein [Hyphomicrobiales bacterium]MCP5370186.1 NADPH:quinone oxidoreductase family protein [Hyphomicrobiales bacterium]
MRAVVCKQWGTPADLEIADMPEPDIAQAASGHGVRIAVKAAGVNFADTLIIAGKYQVKPEHPFSPGLEFAGEVLETAPGVTKVKPGDRVLGMTEYGAFADQVIAEEDRLYTIPDNMDFVSAAAFAVTYGTSHLGLTRYTHLRAGETLLVHGAAGGVGLTAVEIGKRLGAKVIATAGGADKLTVPARYGADHLIDYRAEDIRGKVLEFTDGAGVDVVYDPVGGKAFDASLRCVRFGARMLIVGFASGSIPQIPANILLVKNVSAIGYYWGAHRKFAPQMIADSFTELFDWYRAGELKPHVSHTLPLEQVSEALDILLARKSTGKVVLTTG